MCVAHSDYSPPSLNMTECVDYRIDRDVGQWERGLEPGELCQQ